MLTVLQRARMGEEEATYLWPRRFGSLHGRVEEALFVYPFRPNRTKLN